MAIWEKILLGMGAMLLVFVFWPGARAALARSREQPDPDWKSVLIPILAVVLFVIVLIYVARGS